MTTVQRTALKEIAKSKSRLSIITTENKGASAARNTGLDIAVGEYVTFVDADDLIESDYIEKMVKSIGEADFCMSGCKTWYQHKNEMIMDRCVKGNNSRKEFLRWLFHQDEYVVGIGWKLYRKAFIDKNRIRFSMRTDYSEDTMFFFDVLLHFESGACINETGYVIRVHDRNSLSQQNIQEAERFITILRGYAEIRNAATDETLRLIILRQQIRTIVYLGRVYCYQMDSMRERRKAFFFVAEKFQIKSTCKLGKPLTEHEALMRLTLRFRLFVPFYVATKLFLHFKKEYRKKYEKSEKQIG